MKILWFTWKDIEHPNKGGAEIVNHEIARRLVEEGHELVMLVARGKGQEATSTISGYQVRRGGNRVTVYLWAAWHYLRNLRGWADLSLEEVNTVPFFTQFYVRTRRVLIIYQLSRQVWFYQMFFPLSYVGYWLEHAYMWLLRKSKVVTISKSSKQDLVKQGFAPGNIGIMRVGADAHRLKTLPKPGPFRTIVSFGTIRTMKQTLDQVQAFEIAREKLPDLRLVIAGAPEGAYGEEVDAYIANSRFKDDIQMLGRVSEAKRRTVMQAADVIVVTSVKEGWGLIVTEAANLGTPAVVYDRDGLRDSAFYGKGGWIVAPSPEAMGRKLIKVAKNPKEYAQIRKQAHELAKDVTFANSYKDFKRIAQID